MKSKKERMDYLTGADRPKPKPTHSEPSPLCGKTVTIKSGTFKGKEYVVEDWHDRVLPDVWWYCDGNPACLGYAVRSAADDLSSDLEVLYGKIDGMGYLVHISEIEEES